MIQTTLADFALPYFRHEERDVSFHLYPFISEYLHVIKKKSQKGSGGVGHDDNGSIQDILQAIILKMMYGPDEYEEADLSTELSEDGSTVDNLRKNYLKPMFDIILSLEDKQQRNLEYVQQAISRTLTSGISSASSGSGFSEIEIALYLLLLLSEKIDLAKSEEEPMRHLISSMIKSSHVISHKHPAVTLQFFENIVRFGQAGFFTVCDNREGELMHLTLAAFLGSQGVHHVNEAVRRRLWYLFLRWLKLGRVDVSQSTEYILNGISDLMVVPARTGASNFGVSTTSCISKTGKVSTGTAIQDPDSLAIQSVCNIFEAVGVLVGKSTSNNQLAYLNVILGPLVSQMRSSDLPRTIDLLIVSGAFFKGIIQSLI